ncbi:ABC transporter permease [Mesoterricola sediminis]|uniref:ABC transporter permease n=1 Tax=Mesoterricola sediminis TaxID=2927980 RepID=A0AA48GS23_9BACT|nr:ABC transporter permease [Mesoterricola sediminis]BDU78221.1 ABC transporter permease [Mesoterricola sediminis]
MATFESFVAARYLHTRTKGAFVKVMVRFARWGIALGVFAMVVALAIANGLMEEIQGNLFSATGHFTVCHVSGDIPGTDAALAKIRSTPGVVAANPMRLDRGLVRPVATDAPPSPILVKAVDPASAHGTSRIFDTLKPGRVEDLKEGEIILGRQLCQDLGLRVGDTVAVVFLRLEMSLSGLQPRMAAYRIAGIFESHIGEYDKSWGIIHINDAMRLASTSEAEMIEVRTTGVDAIERVKGQVLAGLNGKPHGPWFAQDLRDTNRALFAALKVEKWMMGAIFSLIVLIAVFNIVASLVLLVTEKRRDLGVLLALGATPAQVQRLFELQGVRIGAVGTLWGLGTSVPLCLLADHYRLIKLPSAVYDFITYVPLRLSVTDILVVAAFPLLVAWAASRYPARRAASVDPVDALRAQ